MNKELQQHLNAHREWNNQIQSSLGTSLELIRSSLEPYTQMQEQILEPIVQLRKALEPYEELRKTFTISQELRQSLSQISETSKLLSQSISASLLKEIGPCISANIIGVTRQILNEFDFSQITAEQTNSDRKMDLQLFGDKEEDYVTADESLIKEIDLTETITIPIGNNRIKMKTEHCIKILISLVSALWILCTYFNNDDTEQATSQPAEQESALTEQELLGILDEFLESIDTSNSSDADSVEYWKGYAQGLLSNHFESPESPDIPHSEIFAPQDTVLSDESVALSEDCPSQLQSESHDSCPEPTGIESESQCIDSED